MTTIPEARFVLSKSAVLEKYKEAKSLADYVSYSVKTNYQVAGILEDLTESRFSIHFKRSIDKIKDKSRILFFAQGWFEEDLIELFGKGVCSFVVDNQNDLKVLTDYLSKNQNSRINLFLRMKMREHTIHTGKHYVYGLSSNVVNLLIPELRKNSCIEKLGLHFHRKTQNVSEWSLKNELQDSLKDENLKMIDEINIGGGLPVNYKNYSASIIEDIKKKIIELREWLNSKNIMMTVEPGRFIAAPTVKLEAYVTNIYDNNIVINCSVFNSAMDTFIANIRLEIEGELEETDKNGEAFTVKGCTPDSMDIFRYRVFLKRPKVGDKIIFLNAGAYNFSTDFCSLKKPETVIID